jgi:hypothetical protein
VFADRAIVEVQASNPVEAMRVLDRIPDVEKTSLFGTAVHAVLKSAGRDAVDVLRRELTAASVAAQSVDRVQPSLEDVFLDVVDRQEAHA